MPVVQRPLRVFHVDPRRPQALWRRLAYLWLGLSALSAFACRDEELGGLTGAVHGQICNPVTNRPVVGATVKATFTPEGADAAKTKSTTTSENGFFELAGIATGDAKIVASTDEFVTQPLVVTVVAGEAAELDNPACFDQPPPPGFGSIVGQVCNRHIGAFVKGGTVSVLLPDGSTLTTTTDATTGIFALDDVPAGVHVVYVQADGFQKTYTVTVVDGEQVLLEEQTATCEPPDPQTTGKIVGRICAAEEAGQPGQPLAGVHVEIVSGLIGAEGAIFEDETLDDGSFVIAGIPAPQAGLQVRAEKGGFSYQWDDVNVFTIAEVPDGTNLTAEVACQPLEPDGDQRFLVVNGTFDDIGNVLERMGLGASITYAEGVPTEPGARWMDEVFANYEELSAYDAIFINCGVVENDYILGLAPAISANLRRYVQEGGSLYVSDWAYDIVEQLYPERINFLGDDTENSAAEFAVGDRVYSAQVMEPGLAEYLESESINIDYGAQYFTVISDVAPGVVVYLRADMQYYVNDSSNTLVDSPVTVGFADGLGRVMFTTFHQEINGADGDEVLDGPEDLAMRYIVFSL